MCFLANTSILLRIFSSASRGKSPHCLALGQARKAGERLFPWPTTGLSTVRVSPQRHSTTSRSHDLNLSSSFTSSSQSPASSLLALCLYWEGSRPRHWATLALSIPSTGSHSLLTTGCSCWDR